MSENTISLRERILNDPDFDTLVQNARKYLEQNSLTNERTKEGKRGSGLKTRAALATGAALTTAATLVGSGLNIPAPVTAADRESSVKTDTQNDPNQKLPVLEPASTATATSTVTPTQTSTPTPEVRTFSKDIFRDKIAPKIYEQVQQKRHERDANDPDFRERVNFALAEGRINLLVTGSAIRTREETGETTEDALTDSIQLLSYHIASNTLNIISLPRDLESPEVLKRSGRIQDSRINQAIASGRNWDDGVSILKQAVENATSLPVDFYMHVNTDVLADLIDKTVGDIDVVLEKAIVDNTYPTENYGTKRIYYPKGLNTINGAQAVEIARSRHSSSDYERSQIQQKIIQAWINKLLEGGNLLDKLNKLNMILTANKIWYEKVNSGDLKADFDINSLFLDALKKELSAVPVFLGGGVKIAQFPEIISTGITNRNLVTGAGIGGTAISKIAGGNPNSPNPRRDYWQPVRRYITNFLEKNIAEPPPPEAVEVLVSPKVEKIIHPKEASIDQTKAWMSKIPTSLDSVTTKVLSMEEFAKMPKEVRDKTLHALARSHTKALLEHYGDTEAIIGIDPSHGPNDIGFVRRSEWGEILRAKDLTWQLTDLITQEIYEQSLGRYTVVILRPNDPHSKEISRTAIAKATLLQTEFKSKKPEEPLGKNTVYLSLDLNPSNQLGVEAFWPHQSDLSEPNHASSSKSLAEGLQRENMEALRSTGLGVVDLDAKQYPSPLQ